MTYNIHSGVGIDGKLALERIARVIARVNPDVVALQEVDVGKHRSEGVDQAETIARQLEMNVHFHPAIHVEDEKYGDAILTHHPLKLIKADCLPGQILTDAKKTRKSKREPRGAIWVVVEVNGINVNIFNTHLGLSFHERTLQIEELMGENWLGHPDCIGPVILCGDFNAVASSGVCRRLRQNLLDVQRNLLGHRPKATFYSRMPVARIDHIFVSRDIRVISIEVPRNQLTLMASDHLPLVTDLQIA